MLQTLFTKSLKECQTEIDAGLGNVHTILVVVKSEVLQEVSQVAFVRVMRSSPLVDVRVSLQELTSDSIIS